MDDERLSVLWEDVTMTRLSHKVTAAEQHLEMENIESNILALADAQKARDRFQTEVYMNRSQRKPENAALRLELGRRWKQAGKMQDAYQCFVAALNDEACKGPAALEMADCLERSNQIPEALQYYRVAADSPPPADDQPDCRLPALYRAGVLASQLQLPRLAERYLTGAAATRPRASRGKGTAGSFANAYLAALACNALTCAFGGSAHSHLQRVVLDRIARPEFGAVPRPNAWR